MLTEQVCAPQPSWLPFSPVFWLLFPLLWSLPRYQLSCCRIQEALFAQIFPSVPAPETWAEAAPWAPNATPEPRLLDQALRCDEAGNQVAGAWSSWGPWSSCSQPCGVGVLERVRTCLPPYQRAPWGGPHGPHTYAQPLYPEEQPNPYPPRPSYPLHTDGESRAPLSPPGPALPLHHGSALPLNSGKRTRLAKQASRIRESIKPGKYGYGKVPFALPLHKERAPSSGRAPRPRGELRLTHEGLKNHSSALEAQLVPKGRGAGGGHKEAPELSHPHSHSHRRATGAPKPRPEATHLTQPEGAGPVDPPARSHPHQLARPRAQRQNEYRPGGYGTRASQSLFLEQPSRHRLAEPDIWLLHRGSPVQFQARGQRPRLGLHPGPEVPQWNLYHPGTETFHCEGESKQFKACRQEPCPADQPDARAVQCAAFNTQEFMGPWIHVVAVRGSQRCELNCRPVGFRFYVRHTEKGAGRQHRARPASLDICVAGECLSPGCDWGSWGPTGRWTAAGCAGRPLHLQAGGGATSGTPTCPIGYHKILQIPSGLLTFPNTHTLCAAALRSRSGKSLINGNWAVDPPGRYEAGGTVFIYTRPGHEEPRGGGESLTAEGPTTEPIDVYVSTEGPGSWGGQEGWRTGAPCALEETGEQGGILARAPASQSRRTPGTLQRNVRVPPLPPPPTPPRSQAHGVYWKTGCSECGSPPQDCGSCWCPQVPVPTATGRAWSPEGPSAQPRLTLTLSGCSWDMGEWSACSKSCGPGTQHRQVLCRQTYANRSTMVHPQHCSQLDKPSPTQPCQLRVCSHWEVRTNWSACSVLCGLGHRTRHIRCISNHGDLLSDGECNGSHRPPANEACDMGPCVRSWFHSDWSNTCSVECGTGIQRRSVVCLSSYANGQVEETCAGTKPADMRACNSGPCHRTVKWYTGPWSECSADCGTGTQRRDVICVSKLGSEFNVTEASECAPLEKPPSLQPCTGSACDARWFSTSWSACSKSCVGGVQVREVQCLTQNKTFSNLCQPDLKPIKKRSCNTQPCTPDLGENCRDKYHNCPVVVQARLCVYSYYKLVCCASCTRAVERSKDMQSR
uniref:ADAMTS like 4 n=1 Tax=Gopherus evgoodei TaxID=1825980 RepID=A0A8C4YAR5_9SAUR